MLRRVRKEADGKAGQSAMKTATDAHIFSLHRLGLLVNLSLSEICRLVSRCGGFLEVGRVVCYFGSQ